MRSARGFRRRPATAGFTLVELMTVVAITGLLAAIAVSIVRKHFVQARANQAQIGLQAIRVGEEGYRAHYGQYLDCSPPNAEWYPVNNPTLSKYDWRTSRADWDCWKQLGVMRLGGTMFGYKVNAGRPGDAYPAFATQATPPLPTPAPDLWYVIQYKGNVDGITSDYSYGVAASYTGDVYIENELK
jgi:prepilin-type N-terminal cleavage/methylation domain-containing protein